MAKMNASMRDRNNRAEGAAFEDIITKSCERYKLQRIAFIEKTPEPFRVTKNIGKGRFEGFYTGQAQPDYKGTLIGGRAICFDAKCTVQDKLQVSALTDNQRECLLKHRELGAWAGVLICFRGINANTYAMIPIETFINAKAINGHAYWSIAETEQNRVHDHGLYITFLDFITG